MKIYIDTVYKLYCSGKIDSMIAKKDQDHYILKLILKRIIYSPYYHKDKKMDIGIDLYSKT